MKEIIPQSRLYFQPNRSDSELSTMLLIYRNVAVRSPITSLPGRTTVRDWWRTPYETVGFFNKYKHTYPVYVPLLAGAASRVLHSTLASAYQASQYKLEQLSELAARLYAVIGDMVDADILTNIPAVTKMEMGAALLSLLIIGLRKVRNDVLILRRAQSVIKAVDTLRSTPITKGEQTTVKNALIALNDINPNLIERFPRSQANSTTLVHRDAKTPEQHAIADIVIGLRTVELLHLAIAKLPADKKNNEAFTKLSKLDRFPNTSRINLQWVITHENSIVRAAAYDAEALRQAKLTQIGVEVRNMSVLTFLARQYLPGLNPVISNQIFHRRLEPAIVKSTEVVTGDRQNNDDDPLHTVLPFIPNADYTVPSSYYALQADDHMFAWEGMSVVNDSPVRGSWRSTPTALEYYNQSIRPDSMSERSGQVTIELNLNVSSDYVVMPDFTLGLDWNGAERPLLRVRDDWGAVGSLDYLAMSSRAMPTDFAARQITLDLKLEDYEFGNSRFTLISVNDQPRTSAHDHFFGARSQVMIGPWYTMRDMQVRGFEKLFADLTEGNWTAMTSDTGHYLVPGAEPTVGLEPLVEFQAGATGKKANAFFVTRSPTAEELKQPDKLNWALVGDDGKVKYFWPCGNYPAMLTKMGGKIAEKWTQAGAGDPNSLDKFKLMVVLEVNPLMRSEVLSWLMRGAGRANKLTELLAKKNYTDESETLGKLTMRRYRHMLFEAIIDPTAFDAKYSAIDPWKSEISGPTIALEDPAVMGDLMNREIIDQVKNVARVVRGMIENIDGYSNEELLPFYVAELGQANGYPNINEMTGGIDNPVLLNRKHAIILQYPDEATAKHAIENGEYEQEFVGLTAQDIDRLVLSAFAWSAQYMPFGIEDLTSEEKFRLYAALPGLPEILSKCVFTGDDVGAVYAAQKYGVGRDVALNLWWLGQPIKNGTFALDVGDDALVVRANSDQIIRDMRTLAGTAMEYPAGSDLLPPWPAMDRVEWRAQQQWIRVAGLGGPAEDIYDSVFETPPFGTAERRWIVHSNLPSRDIGTGVPNMTGVGGVIFHSTLSGGDIGSGVHAVGVNLTAEMISEKRTGALTILGVGSHSSPKGGSPIAGWLSSVPNQGVAFTVRDGAQNEQGLIDTAGDLGYANSLSTSRGTAQRFKDVVTELSNARNGRAGVTTTHMTWQTWLGRLFDSERATRRALKDQGIPLSRRVK